MPYFTPIFSHTPIGPIPAWVPTHALAMDFREWDVRVDPAALALSIPIPNNRLRISIYRILLEAGIAFTRGVGFQHPHLSALAPVYRYIDLFDGTSPNLRLIGGFKHVDSRFKQLLGEEIALGITCYVLQQHMDVVFIADVGPLMSPPPGTPPSVQFSAGHPDDKRPDYYCLDSNGEVVFAESKGAVGTQSQLTGANGPLARGKHQVGNVVPTTRTTRHQCGCVVIGTNIQLHLPGIRSDSMTHIVDPVPAESNIVPTEDDFAIRVAYAKSLRYAGQDVAADLLIARQKWPTLESPPTISLGNLRIVPIGVAPVGGVIGIEEKVFETLRTNQLSGFGQRLNEAIGDIANVVSDLQSEPLAVVLRNGVVAMLNLDQNEFLSNLDRWCPPAPPFLNWIR